MTKNVIKIIGSGITISLSIFLTLYLLFFYMPYNPMTTFLGSYEYKEYVISVFPQGWQFFTRNPREGGISIIEIDNNCNYKQDNNNKLLGNFLAFNRDARSNMVEIARHLDQNKSRLKFKNLPINGNSIYKSKINCSDSDIVRIEHADGKSLLEGKFLIVNWKAIPYIWWQSSKRNNIKNYGSYCIVELVKK